MLLCIFYINFCSWQIGGGCWVYPDFATLNSGDWNSRNNCFCRGQSTIQFQLVNLGLDQELPWLFSPEIVKTWSGLGSLWDSKGKLAAWKGVKQSHVYSNQVQLVLLDIMETADTTGDQIFGAKARGGRRSLLALSVPARQPISTTHSSFQQSGALLADGYSTGHHEQQNSTLSTSPQTISSITTCSRQGGLSSRVQATQSPSLTSLDSVPQTYSLLSIAEVPDSSRLSPKARSSVLSYTKLLYQHVTTRKKGTNPTNSRRRRKQLWKNGGLLPLLLVLSWITFAWWYLSQSKEAASQILQLSPKVQVYILESICRT
jgi:hypothetical protein